MITAERRAGLGPAAPGPQPAAVEAAVGVQLAEGDAGRAWEVCQLQQLLFQLGRGALVAWSSLAQLGGAGVRLGRIADHFNSFVKKWIYY